jgi:hypothetical protein
MVSARQHPVPVEMGACPNIDASWEGEDAADFRELCQTAFGRDSLCDSGSHCPLIA